MKEFSYSVFTWMSGGFPVAFWITKNIFVTISITCPVWKIKSPFFFPSSDCKYLSSIRHWNNFESIHKAKAMKQQFYLKQASTWIIGCCWLIRRKSFLCSDKFLHLPSNNRAKVYFYLRLLREKLRCHPNKGLETSGKFLMPELDTLFAKFFDPKATSMKLIKPKVLEQTKNRIRNWMGAHVTWSEQTFPLDRAILLMMSANTTYWSLFSTQIFFHWTFCRRRT